MGPTVTHNKDAGLLNVKAVPAEGEARRRIRGEAARAAAALDRRRPPKRGELENAGHGLISRLHLSPTYLGFAMVAVNNEFWRDQFMAVPMSRRLLLLPHCLRHVKECKGVYDARGLSCAECGACALGAVKAEAEALGYTVLIAEGTPAVVEVLVRGQRDAILGMACLDSLEQAFSRVGDLGIPHVAVPLLTNGCVATTAEIEVLRDWLGHRNGTPGPRTRSYLSMLRAAERLFEAGALDELLAGIVSSPAQGMPESSAARETEAIAIEWLREGGKRLRPFITLASQAALSCENGTPGPGGDGVDGFPLAVRRVALAIEASHKASLVHDDIEDNDSFRYGRETLHRRYGLGVALNVGDYLIGLGYRLVAATKSEMGADAVADILTYLSEAHTKLCRGQGEELLWSRRNLVALRPEDAQRIYVLKTAPALEAAMCAGVRAAQDLSMDAADREILRRYCRFVGVAYQLLNDFKDWRNDRHGKLVAGQDCLAWRPTMLLALALEAGDPAPFRELASAPEDGTARQVRLESLRKLYEERGAFEKGRKLVEEYRQRARMAADAIQPEALRDLMHFIVEAVL
jgi:geranylgeranyl pyrophosphate synthase